MTFEPFPTKKSLTQPAASLRSSLITWFANRYRAIILLISAVSLIATLGFGGPRSRLGLAYVGTLLIWIGGFGLYRWMRGLSERTASTLHAQRWDLFASLAVVATVYLSLWFQKRLDYPWEPLWPLFFLAPFASVRTLTKLRYGLVVILCAVSLLTLQAGHPGDLIRIEFYWQHRQSFAQVSFLGLFSLILLFMVESLVYQSLNNQKLLEIASAGGQAWFEGQYSQHVLETIANTTRELFNAESADIIFVNRQTGVCYLREFALTPEGMQRQRPSDAMFVPEGPLRRAIESGVPTGPVPEATKMGRWDRLLASLSQVVPIRPRRLSHLYLPIPEHPGVSEIAAVLRVSLYTNVRAQQLASPHWQAALGSITGAVSELFEHRQIVQALHIMSRIGELANQGSASGLYGWSVNSLAALFSCPAALWMRRDTDSDILRVKACSRWVEGSDAGRDYVDAARIEVHRGKLGKIIEEAEEFASEPIRIPADRTEHAQALRNLGVHSLVVIPLISGEGPMGALMLYLLTDAEFGAGERVLMRMLGRQLTMSIERRRTRDFFEDIVRAIRDKAWFEEDRPEIVEPLIARSAEIVDADIFDLHFLEPECGPISASYRAVPGGEIEAHEVDAEGERVLRHFAREGNPIFTHFIKNDLAKALPEGTEACSLLPLSVLGTTRAVLVAAYMRPHRFLWQEKASHKILLFIAEYLLGSHWYAREVRRKLEAEQREQLATRIHDSINDYVLAIKRWAELAEQTAIQESIDREELTLCIEKIKGLSLDSYERLRRLPDLLWSTEREEITRKGFVRAIRDYHSVLGCDARLDIRPKQISSRDIPPDVQIALLKIGKLALSNVVRHAAAKRVDITFEFRRRTVVMEFRDNGRGFDLEAAGARTCRGLNHMRRIAKRAGGACQIVSEVGQGTTIRIRTPSNGGHSMGGEQDDIDRACSDLRC